MDAFTAIEKILHFHHTTSRQPMRVAVLRLRCFQNGTAVSLDDIDQILRIWPQAYKQYVSRGNMVIEAPDLPHNIEQRRVTFSKLWAEKENLPPVNRENNGSKQASVKCNVTHSIQKQKPILMGRLNKEPVNKSLNLLDRIRAKEARLKRENTPLALQRTRDQFLRSQIPKIKRVLEALMEPMGTHSLKMEEIMDIMRTNLQKLGDDEIQRVLEMIMQSYPSFCTIVTVGSATHVKLRKTPSVVC